MCMLTYYPSGVRPDTNALFNGAALNNDGHGFAIVTTRGLIIRHGMDADKVVDQFATMRAKHADGPALFHSRFGTGGRKDRRNCHPFRLRGDRRTVIAHNGVFPREVQPVGKDPRCDTRIAADTVFPYRWGPLHSEVARAAAERWMGKWNKVVILTVNPTYPTNAFILNERAGVWREGTWYSNYDFEDYIPAPVKASDATALTNSDTCRDCGAEVGITVDGWCMVCESCQDCGEDWFTACQCYTPKRSHTADDEYAGWWAAQLREEMSSDDA